MAKKNPALFIDLQKIEHNSRIVTDICRRNGIRTAAVTKGFCAIPKVAEAMLAGGATMLADSRVRNLRRLREYQLNVEYMLLRTPMPSEADEVVECADISLNSEITTIEALNRAAGKRGIKHKIVLMIDVGDLREGVWPDRVEETVRKIVRFESILLEGIGCNLGCYGGVIPTPENMMLLLKQKELIEAEFDLRLHLVSGGSTCGIQLLLSGNMPGGIDHFRVGEGILLGKSTTDCFTIPDCYQDAFVIRTEIIECQWKPSRPIGARGQDAFGGTMAFPDNGLRRRAIVALGCQDIASVKGLVPHDEQVNLLGATSDHLLVDVTESDESYLVGTTLSFYPDYRALLAAATSEYVSKEFFY